MEEGRGGEGSAGACSNWRFKFTRGVEGCTEVTAGAGGVGEEGEEGGGEEAEEDGEVGEGTS